MGTREGRGEWVEGRGEEGEEWVLGRGGVSG